MQPMEMAMKVPSGLALLPVLRGPTSTSCVFDTILTSNPMPPAHGRARPCADPSPVRHYLLHVPVPCCRHTEPPTPEPAAARAAFLAGDWLRKARVIFFEDLTVSNLDGLSCASCLGGQPDHWAAAVLIVEMVLRKVGVDDHFGELRPACRRIDVRPLPGLSLPGFRALAN